MAGNIQILPQRRTGFGDFVDALKPGLEQAFNIYMKKQLEQQQYETEIKRQGQQRQQAYQEAQRMGLIEQLPPTSIPTSSGQANIMPLQGIKVPPQYRLNQQPGMESSMKFSEQGIPQFGQQTTNPLDAQYKQSQIDVNKAVVGSFGGGGTGDLVYRDVNTGVEIPQEEALKNIPQGAQYIINRKIVSRQGVKEEPVVKPEDTQKVQQQKDKVDFIINQAQDSLSTINEVKKGIKHFGLTGQIPSIPGTERYVWETNINKLLSGKMIELMTVMKEASKTGATGFGQLSEKEGQILREASTALKRGLPPDKAMEYLNVMEKSLQKIIQKQEIRKPQGQNQGMGQDPEYQKYLQAIGG